MTRLPVCPAHQLGSSAGDKPRWLIEHLWTHQAVGIVGGEPKSGKSFLILDMAIAVASGSACLRHFPVAQTGRVLLYAAEDDLEVVRRRLEGICEISHLRLSELDIQAITAPYLWLDLPDDQTRLAQTLDQLRPKLLLLDPLVRLHRIDENHSSEVAPLLGYLRELQRQFEVAIAVVHHTRKAAHKLRAGQALRGSSDLHAWGDSNLYLRRRGDQLTLTAEHRAAPAQTNIPLALQGTDERIALAVIELSKQSDDSLPPSTNQRVQQVLARAKSPVPFVALRQSCRMRTSSLCRALAELQHLGKVIKSSAGYQLAPFK